MKASFFILFLICFSATDVFACHNLYTIKKDGLKEQEHRGIPTIEYSFNILFAKEFVAYFDLDKKERYSFKDLSDAAVYLTQLGRIDDALNLLKWLHQKHPEEYIILSNLGTTFELAGELDSAHYYLTQAIAINPNSHHGSEWIHLKILAAKQFIKKDPSWVLNHNVLNLNWDTTFYSGYPNTSFDAEQRDSLRKVRYKIYENQFDTLWHIGIQMRERIPFTPKPNLLIANIMKELGQYLAVNLSVKDAFVAFKIALHYDPQNQLNTQLELDKLMPYFRKYEFDENIFEQKFRPAKAFEEADKKKLAEYRNQKQDEANKASNSLYWQASLALLFLLALLLRFIYTSRAK